jgi:hypothetical protein
MVALIGDIKNCYNKKKAAWINPDNLSGFSDKLKLLFVKCHFFFCVTPR